VADLFSSIADRILGTSNAPGIITQLPQTQQDIKTLATVAPILQQEIEKAKAPLEMYAKTHLTLVAVGTLATLGMLLIQYDKWRREK
jgi:hypothetical protein